MRIISWHSGFKNNYYKAETNEFEEDDIIDRIESIVDNWKLKYPALNFRTKKLKFDTTGKF